MVYVIFPASYEGIISKLKGGQLASAGAGTESTINRIVIPIKRVIFVQDLDMFASYSPNVFKINNLGRTPETEAFPNLNSPI